MPTTTMNRATRAGADLADGATDEAREVATAAAERGGQLARTAREETRDLAETVRDRAGEVTDELAEQGRHLVDETRAQVEARASVAAQQLASTVRDFGEQAQALADGRPEEAPDLTPHVGRAADGLYGAADRLYRLADDVEQRGITGVLDDLQTFARRRPGAFLLGAAVLGFGVGRAVKAEKERQSEEDDRGVQATQADREADREAHDGGRSVGAGGTGRPATALRRPQPALGSRAVR